MLTEQQMRDIERAAQAIKDGGLVVYPTETAYGLGVDATNPEALAKLYALKNMPHNKPTHIAVLNIDEANKYAHADARARALAKAFLPGPLTLVLPTKNMLPKILEDSGNGERSIRIPNHEIALKLLEFSGVPITATSANKHMTPTTYSIEDVKKSFGDDFRNIGYVLDAGVLSYTEPSTLLSLMGKEPKILREGPVTLEQIKEVLV